MILHFLTLLLVFLDSRWLLIPVYFLYRWLPDLPNSNEKLSNELEEFKDCLQFTPSQEEEQYFFDSLEFQDDPLDTISANNDTSKLNFSIKLPEYQTTYLSALSYGSDQGAFVSFNSDSTHCVVDNCANVHIWNNKNDYVQGSYIEFDEDKSTGVSAVNGSTNKPAGIGNVQISWKDDRGDLYEIELRNVLHFPNSPVKILSVVELATQLGDDWDTWILSRRYQSTFTWAFGEICKNNTTFKKQVAGASNKSWGLSFQNFILSGGSFKKGG